MKLLKTNISQIVDYEVDGWKSDKYPNSLLGVVSLMRQTFIDAKWYGEAKKKINDFPDNNLPIKIDNDLDVLSEWLSSFGPFIIKTNHELDILRSFNLSDEFQFNDWYFGNGYEYRRINEISKKQPFIILPLDFPVKPEITEIYQALEYNMKWPTE